MTKAGSAALIPSSISEELEESEGYDLLDIGLFLLRNKRTLALGTIASLLAGLCIAFTERPVFTATAVIMPPRDERSAASSLFGDLGSRGGLSAASGIALKNPADTYVGILQSRVIADNLIERFNLQAAYKERLRVGARSALRRNASFEAAKDGLIYIKVKDHNPQRAAALANGFIDELHHLNSRLATTEAAQRRLFFEQQLIDERGALTGAEDDLRQTEEKTGIIQLTGQEEMTIRNIATARADIANKEAGLNVMRTFATERNPEITRQQQEIFSQRRELQALEDGARRLAPGDVAVPAGRVPAAGLEYLRKLREVRYHEALVELLAKQQAAANLDEAKSTPLIQVVEPAEVPEERSGPARSLIVAGLGLAGFLACATWAILKEALQQIVHLPGQAQRVQELLNALSFRGQ